MLNRRNFLQKSALTTAGSLLIPNFLKAYELNRMNRPAGSQKIVVIVQLSGGNDGLNTVVPYRNELYYRERPTIAIRPDKVLRLTDELGLNPALDPLRALYDDGQMTIINNVGYPNPDRSHFRSMDIWHSASDASQYLNTGWVGRYLDAQCKGKAAGCKGVPYRALEVDDTLSLSMKGANTNGLAVLSPQKLYNQTRGALVKNLSAETPANTASHGNVAYLYKTLAETVSSAEYVYDKARNSAALKTYPASELGQRLKTVAELIQSGVDTGVYYVSIGGFDTHINQPGQQERLLRQYAEAVRSFMDDMKAAGRTQDVLLMTFSEFGRRVKQNASNGTDHGTASNVLLFGGRGADPAARSRVISAAPTLSDLDEGDLKYEIDFRRIYATLLRDWLQTDDVAILGRRFDTLAIV